ncbi:MAG TPA: cation-translocating P-type ATPase, partial [Ktedonobacterales bacterium]
SLVIRDGMRKRIPGRETARGDVVIVAEGDRVPADGIVLEATNLLVDESLLTGESVPVRKVALTPAAISDAAPASEESIAPPEHPGGDDLPYVYSSTLVVGGVGLVEVRQTGPRAQIGQIGRALHEVPVERTHVQQEVTQLVKVLAIGAFALCILVLLAYGILRGHWLAGVLAGITLAMAVIPEEFPLVLTLFLALGAWRLAQRHVLTRRMPAIETLGAMTVLCSDKTGTLTQNRMSVGKIAAASSIERDTPYLVYDPALHPHERVAEPFFSVLRVSALASQTTPFDPMEQALQQLARQSLDPSGQLDADLVFIQEYPLTSELLAVTRVWAVNSVESAHATEPPAGFLVAAKGAPEAIARLCGLDAERREALQRQTAQFAQQGLRVLGVAQAVAPVMGEAAALPDTPHAFSFTLLGLIGLADPIRPTVPAAMRDCDTAGIRVVMITGDYPLTAQAIGEQIGMLGAKGVITGDALATMSDDDLRQHAHDYTIFARVVPQEKLRLVKALRARGEIVGMTGDGVNDAPALRAADIGVAMGGRGTDVAREAAALVLLDDDFTSIVEAVRGGRRIFDNLRKAMAFIFAVHIPIASLALLPVVFGWPTILMPVHIVFLEFIIDPACTLVFESEPAEPDVMRRPPRNPHSRLFSRRLVTLSVLQGISVLAAVLTVFLVALQLGQTAAEARTLAFATLVVADLALILVNRSWTRVILSTLRSPNPALWLVVGGAAVTLAIAIYVPFVASLFHFAVLHLTDVLICLGAGIASILWFEALKVIQKRVKATPVGGDTATV